MHTENTLSSFHSSVENIGYCRLTPFFSPEKQFLVEPIQKGARIVIGIMGVVSALDWMAPPIIPFKVKVLVNGTLLFFITNFFLNLVLKRFAPQPQKKPNRVVQKLARATNSSQSPVPAIQKFRFDIDEVEASGIKRKLFDNPPNEFDE